MEIIIIIYECTSRARVDNLQERVPHQQDPILGMAISKCLVYGTLVSRGHMRWMLRLYRNGVFESLTYTHIRGSHPLQVFDNLLAQGLNTLVVWLGRREVLHDRTGLGNGLNQCLQQNPSINQLIDSHTAMALANARTVSARLRLSTRSHAVFMVMRDLINK